MQHRLLVTTLTALVALAAGGCEAISLKKLAIDHYVRSQFLADEGRLDEALAELAWAVRTDSSLSVAHAAMGDIHRRRGSHELARRSYMTACRTNPYAFRPHYNLGVTYQVLAEAAKTIAKADDYLRSAVQIYLRAVTLEPDDFDANLNISACYFQLGKYKAAEHYCKAAIRLKPDSPQAYSNLGIIYDSQNRLYEAVRAYKTSVELDLHQPQLLLNFGSTYMRQGRIEPALRVFKMAADEAPGDAAPWEQIGACHFHLRQFDEATAAYTRALGLDRNSAPAHRGLGVVYMAQFVLDRSKTDLRDQAIEAWNLSLEIDPDQPDLIRLVRKYAPKYTGPEL